MTELENLGIKEAIANYTYLRMAQTAYEVVGTYERINHNALQPTWRELDDDTKETLCRAVKYLMMNKDSRPSTLHTLWLDSMIESGWVHGKEFDEEKKTHPEMISFTSLSPLERAKDKLFYQMVMIGNVEPREIRVVD